MEKIKLLEGLRDFFFYGTEDKLKESYERILKASDAQLQSDGIDWENEEFTFNRLFVGPATPLSSAVASIYLDPDGHIQGRVTKQVREFYDCVGLSLADEGREPEDSIAYEFDACRYLLILGNELPEMVDAYKEFINEHMALWLPEFTRRGVENCGNSIAVKRVLELVSEWIINESELTLVSKELS